MYHSIAHTHWEMKLHVVGTQFLFARSVDHTYTGLTHSNDHDQDLKTPSPPSSFGLILPRLDTTPRRGRILSRLRRIFDPHCSAPDQPPPLQVLLNLPLHTTLVVFRFPDGHTHPSLVPILTPNYSNQKPNEQQKTSGQRIIVEEYNKKARTRHTACNTASPSSPSSPPSSPPQQPPHSD